MVTSNWEKIDDGIRFDICIPNGTQAEVYLPTQNSKSVIMKDDVLLWRNGNISDSKNGFHSILTEDGYVKFSVLGGKYCFYVK